MRSFSCPTGMGLRIAMAVAVAHVALDARTARAEESLETADGASDCRAFREKNDRELEKWERSQPPVPYRYPRENLFLNAPWDRFFHNLGYSGPLILATLLPHAGAQYRGGEPAASLSWPWSIFVVGPMYACTRKPDTFVVHGHRVHRFMLEPSLVSSNRGLGFSVRPGYRFIWHPTSWVVGPGIGIGSTIEIKGNHEPLRPSIGPELVAHFGQCCNSSYFTLALRYDHFLAGNNRDVIGTSLGYTFF